MITPIFGQINKMPDAETLLELSHDLQDVAKKLIEYSDNIQSAWSGPEIDIFKTKTEEIISDVYLAATETFAASNDVPSPNEAIGGGGGSSW